MRRALKKCLSSDKEDNPVKFNVGFDGISLYNILFLL